MLPIKLSIVSEKGIEATIFCDGRQGGAEDYFSVVSVSGFIENKKIYGVDPLQALSLGLVLIEKLTLDNRIGEDGTDKMAGASWKIEVASD